MADGALFDDSVGRDPRGDTWTVGELSAHLGRVLAGAFPDDVWVEGQIRNLNRSAAGHVYFDLVEPTPAGAAPKAQLSVTLLAPEKQAVNVQLKRAGGAVRMADGIEVRIGGRIRWYGPRGTLQLRMHGIDPAFTLGRLQADRDRLLAALAAEGLLRRQAELRLPLVPLRVGLITSSGSAAHADVLAELAASGIGFAVRCVDARTQGELAAASVTRALAHLVGEGVDLVLIVRGGGARTDLAAFDSELLARAIATAPVAVLTGIGHEVDRSIADEVAHRSHKTPTAAAASVVALVRAFLDQVDRHAAGLHRAVTRSLDVATSRLDERIARSTRASTRTLDRQDAIVAAAGARLPHAARRSLDVAAARLAPPVELVSSRPRRTFDRAERDLDGLQARTVAHDPRHALARGWSITTTDDGRLVRSPDEVAPGAPLITRVAGGQIHSTVTASPSLPATTTETHPEEHPG